MSSSFGRYEIISEIGRGGTGVVYRARDGVLEREVALKILRADRDGAKESVDLLKREAKAAAAVSHPNAVSIYDVGEHDGQPYIAMELVEGKTLRAFVGADSPPIAVRVRWLADIARALGAAHARGIVHRDVKPENVMVRADGVIKVLDFGIARPVGHGGASTQPGMVVGTPHYMSPEQMRSEPLDAASDQFAWGVVAYELLTGGLPWGSGGRSLRTLLEHVDRSPMPLSDWGVEVDGAIEHAILRSLAPAKADRHPSMDAAVAALEARAAPAAKTAVLAKRRAPSIREGAEEEEEQDRLPPTLGGKYVPIRCIAKGGMGAVYEVEHAHTGERWALKLMHRSMALDAATIARFRREARVSARVKSDHIVRVIDADVAKELDGTPYLVMELLEGRDLGDIAGEVPQARGRVVGWLRQVATALDKAHSLSIIHRDLKPENLFLARKSDGTAMLKVLDFGVAKIESNEARQTKSGTIVGTPLYMAPEQAAGSLDTAGPSIDVWAIGMVAFRLLSGREYWNAPSVSHLLAEIISAPIESPSARGLSLGEGFDAWFLRSCARDPNDRYPSVGEQVEALAECLGVPKSARGDDALFETVPEIAAERNTTSPEAQSLAGASTDRRARGRRSMAAVILGAGAGLAIAVAAFVWRQAAVEKPIPVEGVTASSQSPAPIEPIESGVVVTPSFTATASAPASAAASGSQRVPAKTGAPQTNRRSKTPPSATPVAEPAPPAQPPPVASNPLAF